MRVKYSNYVADQYVWVAHSTKKNCSFGCNSSKKTTTSSMILLCHTLKK